MSNRDFKLKVVKGESVLLAIDTIEWRDPYWEFDFPSAILRPIFKGFETGKVHELMVENFCIDAVVFRKVATQDFESLWAWRGYSLGNLRRVFGQALRGKTFPKLRYTARRTWVRFHRDEQGVREDKDVLTWSIDGEQQDARQGGKKE